MDALMASLSLSLSTPPASVYPVDEERTDRATTIRFRSVAALFRELDDKSARQEDFALVEGVTPREFAAIDKARAKRSTHERFHYRLNDQNLYISLPTRSHERTNGGLTTLLTLALDSAGVPFNEYAMDLATTYLSGDGAGGCGEGDQVFVPHVRDATPGRWPTLVIETGVSQSPNDLRRKMAWWFLASDHQVKIVLLVKVERVSRTLLIDKYTKDVQQSLRPGAMTTRNMPPLVPHLRQSIVVAPRPGADPVDELFDVVGAPLLLEFALLFLRPADPARGENDLELSADRLASVAALTFR